MKAITTSVLRKLKKMKLRLIGIVLVIAVAGSMLIAGLYGSGMMDASVEHQIEKSNMADVFIDLSEPVNGVDLDAVFGGSPEVEEYALRLKAGGYHEHKGVITPALLIGIRDPDDITVNKLELQGGRMFAGTGQGVAIAGLDDKGLGKGDVGHFVAAGRELNITVTGTVLSSEFMFPSSVDYTIPMMGTLVVLFVPLEDVGALLGDGFNEVTVVLAEGGSREDLTASLGGLPVTSVLYQEDHPSVLFMKVGSDKFRMMMPLMSAIFMLIGFISIFMTVYRLVQNDSRYIGVLMSLGYTRQEITRAYMAVGTVLAVAGSVIGVIFGMLWTLAIVGVSINMYGNMSLVMPFLPLPFILGILYIFAVVLISVYIPIRMITRTSVREALEYKPRTRIHTTGAGAGRMSKVTLMGLRNATRNPGRTALTIVVVGITIGAAGSWLVLVDSAMGHFDRQIESETWDLRVDLLTPMDEDAVDRAFLGLDPAETTYFIHFASLQGTASRDSNEQGTAVLGCDQMARVRDFDVKEGKVDVSGAIITDKLSEVLEAGPGDEIEVDVGSQVVALEVTAVVYDANLYSVYTDRANLAGAFPRNMASGVYIQLEDPDAAGALAEDIRLLPQVSNAVVHSEMSEGLHSLVDQAMGMLYTFFVLHIMIAFVVAGSAVIISSMERDVEYATLDSLGIPRSRVAGSIMVEMGLMGVLAAAVGIPASYGLGWVFAIIMEDIVFYFPVVFAVGVTLTIFFTGLFFVLLSAFIPIRYAGKLDTEKTIRERTAG